MAANDDVFKALKLRLPHSWHGGTNERNLAYHKYVSPKKRKKTVKG